MQSKTWVLIKSWVEEGKFRLFQREDHSLQSSASAAKLRQTRENPSPLSLLLFFSRLSTASTVLEARSLFKSFPRWCLATFHLLAFPRDREIHARQLEKELDFTASKSKGFFFFLMGFFGSESRCRSISPIFHSSLPRLFLENGI